MPVWVWVQASFWLSSLRGVARAADQGEAQDAEAQGREIHPPTRASVPICGKPRYLQGIGASCTCDAAACYSPTPCRVQYHRRARP